MRAYLHQEFVLGIAIAQFRGPELLVPAHGFAAAGLAFVFLGVGFAVPAPMGGVALEALAVLQFKAFLLCLGFPPIPETELLKGIVAAFHDVEAVQREGCIREGLVDDGGHALGQVSRHFLYPKPLLLRYLEQNGQDFFRFSAPHCGYQRSQPAMAILVCEEREQVILEGRFVDAQMLSHVPRQQHPVRSIIKLLPVPEPAQRVFVAAFKVVSVNEKELTQASGRHRQGVQEHLLKKPQTLRNNVCPERPADRGSARCSCPRA